VTRKRRGKRPGKASKKRPHAPRETAAADSGPKLVLEVSRLQLAALLGVHEDTVSKFSAKGMPVFRAGGNGESSVYDAVACLAWWREQQNVTTGGGANLAGARARLSTIQSERAELELRRRRGDLVEAADVQREWLGIVTATRERFRALPSAVADRLVTAAASGGTAGVQRELATEIDTVLTELSRTGADAPAEARA